MMALLPDEIELSILKIQKNDKWQNDVKSLEENFFKTEVNLSEYLFSVAKIFCSLNYLWQAKIPSRKRIREKLEKMRKLTNKLIEEFRNNDEMIILENEYGKTEFFDSKRNFSLCQRELEQHLLIYDVLLKNIPSTKGGPNSKPSYKDIVQLLLPFFQKNKTSFVRPTITTTTKHGDTNVYPGDDTKFVMRVMPLLKEIYPPIELVAESSIGDCIINLYKQRKP